MSVTKRISNRIEWVGVLLVVILLLPLLAATAQDTGAPDSVVLDYVELPERVSTPLPIRIVNDEPLDYIVLALLFSAGDYGAFVSIDSIVYRGRLADPGVLDMRQFHDGNVDGVTSDSLVLGWIKILGQPLPPGEGVVADLYLTGSRDGSIWIDSCFVPPSNHMEFRVQSGESPVPYTPAFTARELPILMMPLPPEFTLPEQALVMANHEVSFEVAAVSPEGYDQSLVLVGMEMPLNPGLAPSTAPITSGDNPLTFQWSPVEADIGMWSATFESCNLFVMTCEQAASQIQVIGEADLNNSGTVTLTDLTLLVNWLFVGLPAPPNPAAADVNVSGEVNLTDVTLLVNCLFLSP